MVAYGATVVLTPSSRGLSGALLKAENIAHSLQESFLVDELGDPAGVQAHKQSTSVEIWKDTHGLVDIIVIGAEHVAAVVWLKKASVLPLHCSWFMVFVK